MKKFTAKTVVVIAIGAALYGVGGLLSIPLFANTTLRPATAILAIFAALFGPIVGFLVGILGHALTDLFGGWGFWPSWILGSGIAGLIIGFFGKATSDRLEGGEFPVKDLVLFICMGLGANFIGYSISAILDYFLYSEPLNKVIVQQLVSSGTNTLMIALIGTAILKLIANRNKQESNLSED
jgi:energy-coupling factor transport system substrate-specific component